MTNKFSGNFFRNDLKLNNRWWHRFAKVMFTLLIITLLVFSYTDFNLVGFTKVARLDSFIDEKPLFINEKLKDVFEYEFIVSDNLEPNNGKHAPEYLSFQESLVCSSVPENIFSQYQFQGYEFWKGQMFNRTLVSEDEFVKYMKEASIKCVVFTSYTNTFGGTTKMLQSYDYLGDLYVYKKNNFKTSVYFIFGTFGNSNVAHHYPGVLLSVFLPLIILMFLYYKVFLYIIFGNKK